MNTDKVMETKHRKPRRIASLMAAATLGLAVTHATVGRADNNQGQNNQGQNNDSQGDNGQGDDSQGDGADWPTFNHDNAGTRYNSTESTLGVANASGLKIKWQFPTPAPVPGTPVVAKDMVYAGDMSGLFYALNRNGKLLWSRQLAGPVTASALVTESAIVIGDINGNLYGLKPSNGAIVWQMRPDAHPVSAIWGSAIKIGKYIAIGVASNEESAAADPNYPCCSTRGSLVMLDPKDGSILWQYFTISDSERAQGASGATIWSTPTYDPASKLIYVTTGNNFSEPTTGLSDAIIAVDARTGAFRWGNQRTADDLWNYRYPTSEEHPDFDFGDSPQIYRLQGGRKVVGAGQKSGFYHVVDAATGALINEEQLEPGGSLGGLFADTAVANGVVFANGINWSNPSGGGLPVTGDLVAVSGDGVTELWRYTIPYSPVFGGVAVANSVVYFTASFSGRLFALDAKTGAVLTALPVGASESGPSVSRGQVYVGTGDALSAGFQGAPQTGTITALGL